MDAIEMIKERRSIRKFKNEKVDRELMKEIVDIAKWAPSWVNYQIARYTLVDDEEIIKEMINEYEDENRGIRLISINGAYQLVTKSENSDYIQKLLKKNKKHSLSQASIESLAIIAYKQPITRIDIDEIRGVKSESAIARLIERGLIKDIGRLEVPGRPILYGTTDEFLRQFGLKTIKELPSLDLYSDEETQSSIDLLNKAIEDMEPEVDDFENNDNENNIEEEVAEEMNEAAIDEDK